MFKKRTAKAKGTIRKTRALEDGDDDTQEAEQLALIADLREEQRDRKKASGLQLCKLMEMSDQAKLAKARKHEEEEKGQQDVAGPDLKALMKNQFSGEVGKHEEDKAHARRMEEFIEEKMGTKKQELPGKEVRDQRVIARRY